MYSTALAVATCDPTDSCHIDAVLGGIIQPLLQSCRLGGQALQQAEMAIFMLNNVSVLQVRGGLCYTPDGVIVKLLLLPVVSIDHFPTQGSPIRFFLSMECYIRNVCVIVFMCP